jgi:hypothetical protein
MLRRFLFSLVALAMLVSACAGDSGSTGPDLDIERRSGYAVIVEDRPDGVQSGSQPIVTQLLESNSM